MSQYSLYGQRISETYPRLLQITSGDTVLDGSGDTRSLYVNGSFSADTIFIGSSDLNNIFAPIGAIGSGATTFIRNGLNTYTGGTLTSPTVNISAATLSYLSATTISGETFYSGATRLDSIFASTGSTYLPTQQIAFGSSNSGITGDSQFTYSNSVMSIVGGGYQLNLGLTNGFSLTVPQGFTFFSPSGRLNHSALAHNFYAGNVGIGTEFNYTPTYKLEVIGDVSITGTTRTNNLSATTISGGTFYGDGSGLSGIGNSITVTLSWKFNTSITESDPGNSYFRFNSATPSSISKIYVDTSTSNGINASVILNKLRSGNELYIQQKDDANTAILFSITSSTIDNSGWFTIPVSYVSSNGGTVPQNNKDCLFILFNDPTADSNTYVTGFTYNDANRLTIQQNGVSDLSVTVNTMTGLTVSGVLSATTISGSSLNLNGAFKYADGNESQNKVLTSDAFGNATWQHSSSYGSGTFMFVSGASSIDSSYHQMVSLNNYVSDSLQIHQSAVTTTPTLLCAFATNSNYPGIQTIPIGVFTCHYETEKVAGSNNYYTFFELYKYTSGGSEQYLFSSDTSSETSSNNIIQNNVNFFLGSAITLDISDRLIVKIYATMLSSTAQIRLRFDDSTGSAFSLPSSIINTNSYVPYSGATSSIDLGTNNMTLNELRGNYLYSGSTDLYSIFAGVGTAGSTYIAPTQIVFGNYLSATTGSTRLTFIDTGNTSSLTVFSPNLSNYARLYADDADAYLFGGSGNLNISGANLRIRGSGSQTTIESSTATAINLITNGQSRLFIEGTSGIVRANEFSATTFSATTTTATTVSITSDSYGQNSSQSPLRIYDGNGTITIGYNSSNSAGIWTRPTFGTYIEGEFVGYGVFIPSKGGNTGLNVQNKVRIGDGQFNEGDTLEVVGTVRVSGYTRSEYLSATTFSAQTIQSNSLTGSTNSRIVEANSGGTISATKQIISAYGLSTTVKNLLEDRNNWYGGIYTGTTITGTYQGQKHYNIDYFFEAVENDLFIRLPRV